MKTNKISVISNFCIDSEERFLRMIDSFNSFKDANISNWCLNLRGNFKEKAAHFLKEEINDKLVIFHYESKEGWAKDTEKLLHLIDSDYLLIWVEDHICLKDINHFNKIIDQMIVNEIDYLKYTFFYNKSDPIKINYVNFQETDDIYFFNFNNENYEKLKIGFEKEKIQPNYILSLPCIINKKLFIRNLELTKKNKKYDPMVPFNFERPFYDIKILPFKTGILKKELFASIDDDKDIPNSSLIGRGAYKNRISRDELLEFRDRNYNYFRKSFFNKLINFIKRNIKFIKK